MGTWRLEPLATFVYKPNALADHAREEETRLTEIGSVCYSQRQMHWLSAIFFAGCTLAPAFRASGAEGFDGPSNLAAAVVNDYVRLSTSPDFSSERRAAWIASDDRFAPEFKKRFVLLEKAAWKKNPEIGWDADPILDAQDVPRGRYRAGKTLDSGSDAVSGVLVVPDRGWNPLPFSAARIGGTWRITALGTIQ